MPASGDAAEKESKLRVTPGSTSEAVVNGMSSVPQNAVSAAAAAPLNVLWPEMYSGKFGVTSSGVHVASLTVPGLPSLSAFGMAVTGRQKLKAYLQSHATMPASASAMFNSANSRAF